MNLLIPWKLMLALTQVPWDDGSTFLPDDNSDDDNTSENAFLESGNLGVFAY